ncbi:MAG TPA: hypothetical protein VL147_18475 [Devosia sp.]|nr:hypothetical protein [Devosia sp.]
MTLQFENPFRPGAGHMPPYLAGRKAEEQEFRKLLSQTTILDNLILTGLRGVGKTVLLETLKPIAIQEKWLWVGTDLSETTSVSEHNFAIRILTDLSVVTSAITLTVGEKPSAGFGGVDTPILQSVNFEYLKRIFDETPGLVLDKLKNVLELVWQLVKRTDRRGVIFAYDEAQNLADNSAKEQFPLSVMLDLFQSIQRKGIPFMLALVGLPTLFPKLVEARTFAERMFRVVSLGQLGEHDRRDAITKPVSDARCPIKFSAPSVAVISDLSGGYPYFIQFICREVFDVWIQRIDAGESASIPVDSIQRKLDTDFFAGRWARATDRQREMLLVISTLENRDAEFSVQDIVDASGSVLEKGFGSSHTNQMLVALANAGLIYKNRYGRYSLAVPLMADFIRRQTNS